MNRFRLSAAALALAFGACASAADLRVGFSQDALTLDPANHRKRETETIIRNMCDGLLTRDSAMKVVPEVAESYRQIDAKTWELKLRKNVKFHSGAVLTAEDVKFTLDRLTKDNAMGGQTSPRKDLLGPISSVEVVDPLRRCASSSRVRGRSCRRCSRSRNSSARASSRRSAMPHWPRRWTASGRSSSSNGGVATRIIMERFADYYGGSPAIPPVGPARVDRVIFRIIPENSSRVAALLAGEVDIVNELPVSAIKQVDASGRAKVMKANGTRTFFVAHEPGEEAVRRPARPRRRSTMRSTAS